MVLIFWGSVFRAVLLSYFSPFFLDSYYPMAHFSSPFTSSTTLAPLLAAVVVDVLINVVGWAASSMLQTEQLYDLLGVTAHLLSAGLALHLSSNRSPRNIVAAGLVMIWATRLGIFLFSRVVRAGKDRRFEKYIGSPAKFSVLWIGQSLWVLFNLLPLLTALCSSVVVPLGLWDGLAVGAWILGIGLEPVADEQKRVFRDSPSNANRFIDSGVWSLSRHTNYVGKIVLQVALAAFCAPAVLAVSRAGNLPSSGAGWAGLAPLALLSPSFIDFLLTLVSGVPLLEADAQKRWGKDDRYKAYVARTPVLFFWPWPRR